MLAGAGAASSLCIPPAKGAPKATCRPSLLSSAALRALLLAPALSNHYLARQRLHAGLHLQIYLFFALFFFFFWFVFLQLWEAIFKPRVGGDLCITIRITLKFTLFFGLRGGFSCRNLAAGTGIACPPASPLLLPP